MPFQFMRCCSISKMYLHNERNFVLKRMSLQRQINFNFRFSAFFARFFELFTCRVFLLTVYGRVFDNLSLPRGLMFAYAGKKPAKNVCPLAVPSKAIARSLLIE
jgi:hypothetical protein